ncbi:MAG: orotidine-5'-phosphate decarboxylase [Candidatus Moranbacteria bacterium]|nr:orotidine-5'-phosphate decarboxylase [Candidatus Moranbacteria bacterium]
MNIKSSTFVDRLQAAMIAKKSVLCVGLDPQFQFMPLHLVDVVVAKHEKTWEALGHLYYDSNVAIIDAIEPFAVAVKPQLAFYTGSHFLSWAFEATIAYAHSKGLLVINDAKCTDGGETAKAYAGAHIGGIPFFDGEIKETSIRADAVTVGAGYIGEAGVLHFVNQIKTHGTGAFVVDKTSFAPNSAVEQLVTQSCFTVWEELAKLVSVWGEGTEGQNGYRNLGVVMGATFPEDAVKMRRILPKGLFLGPGYGGQGATANDCAALFNDDGFGAVINSSRGVTGAWAKGQFACDSKYFAQAAAKSAEFSRDDLNAGLKRAGKYPF